MVHRVLGPGVTTPIYIAPEVLNGEANVPGTRRRLLNDGCCSNLGPRGFYDGFNGIVAGLMDHLEATKSFQSAEAQRNALRFGEGKTGPSSRRMSSSAHQCSSGDAARPGGRDIDETIDGLRPGVDKEWLHEVPLGPPGSPKPE